MNTAITVFSLCQDEPVKERKITISRNETLNIYIAIDISEDIPLEDIENAKDAVKKLITKVKTTTTKKTKN